MNNSPAERRERIARIIDADAFDKTKTKDWASLWIIKRQHDARDKADAILSSDLVGTGSEETPLAKRDRA